MLNKEFTDPELATPRVYIAGPMTGLPNSNRSAFHASAVKLIKGEVDGLGFCIPLNPAILPDGLSQAEYMQICIPMLMVADMVYALSGWECSDGAKAEIALAKKLQKPIFYQPMEPF